MSIEMILFLFTFILVALASIFDLKTREVPDTLSYIFILGVLGISLLYSAYSSSLFFVYGLLGGAIFFLFGYILYITKQMGGADVKLLTGLGIVFANDFVWGFPLSLLFFFSLLFIGAVYTLIWGMVLYVKSLKQANKKAKELLQEKKTIRFTLFIIALMVFIFLFFIDDPTTRLALASAAILAIATFYLYIFIKIVEELHFLKKIPVAQLTEGDWLAKDVHIGEKLICSAKHPCLDKKQIEQLKKAKVEFVMIKVGIPFVPAIFLAVLASYALYFFV